MKVGGRDCYDGEEEEIVLNKKDYEKGKIIILLLL